LVWVVEEPLHSPQPWICILLFRMWKWNITLLWLWLSSLSASTIFTSKEIKDVRSFASHRGSSPHTIHNSQNYYYFLQTMGKSSYPVLLHCLLS
jgi:hypothetical protein